MLIAAEDEQQNGKKQPGNFSGCILCGKGDPDSQTDEKIAEYAPQKSVSKGQTALIGGNADGGYRQGAVKELEGMSGADSPGNKKAG